MFITEMSVVVTMGNTDGHGIQVTSVTKMLTSAVCEISIGTGKSDDVNSVR